MSNLNVSPDRLDEVSGLFKHASTDCNQTFTTLSQALTSLEAEWRGTAATKFFNDFAQWQATTRQFVELLDAVGTQLKQVADHYRSADQPH